MEVHRGGVNQIIFFDFLPAQQGVSMPKSKNSKGDPVMKPYYVAHQFYLPVGYTLSLINNGVPKDLAVKQTIDRFAYFGKRNSKRNKDFNQVQFIKHIDNFLNTPNAVLCRKSAKR